MDHLAQIIFSGLQLNWVQDPLSACVDYKLKDNLHFYHDIIILKTAFMYIYYMPHNPPPPKTICQFRTTHLKPTLFKCVLLKYLDTLLY